MLSDIYGMGVCPTCGARYQRTLNVIDWREHRLPRDDPGITCHSGEGIAMADGDATVGLDQG